VSTDLYELFESLVLPLERPTGRSLSAVGIPGAGSHRLAKDVGGSPCLLLRQPASASPTPPIRLQNLLVPYGVPCAISHSDGQQEDGTFTIIKCSSADPSLFPHFLRILSPIITTLGPTPTAAAVRRAISGLVDLFQALTAPAKKSIQGLWAELLIIRRSADPVTLVAAWHGLPIERIDFLRGKQRIEVKSSSNRRRVHHFSLEQLTPPASARLVVASLFVEPVGGGCHWEGYLMTFARFWHPIPSCSRSSMQSYMRRWEPVGAMRWKSALIWSWQRSLSSSLTPLKFRQSEGRFPQRWAISASLRTCRRRHR
jgi:hypothetical protein